MQLQVYEAALGGTEQEFRDCAQRWLASGIAFDGLLWGHGRRMQQGGLVLEHASVLGRPQAMLDEYGEISSIDPLCWTLIDRPGLAHNVALRRHYASHPCLASATYWCRHRVEFLLMCGQQAGAGGALGWIKLLRAPGLPPFSVEDQEHAQMAVPLILQAGQLQQDKLASRSLQRESVAATPAAASLTCKELLVAAAYAEGHPVKQIAKDHNLSASTVQSHLQHIFRKLGVHSKLQLRDKMPPGAGSP
jgi:DNA-binding CsgD family transcriptional regulator